MQVISTARRCDGNHPRSPFFFNLQNDDDERHSLLETVGFSRAEVERSLQVRRGQDPVALAPFLRDIPHVRLFFALGGYLRPQHGSIHVIEVS